MAIDASHGTLTATTVATVNLSGAFQRVEVMNVNGADIIYFTVDGSVPTVAGDDTICLPAVAGAAYEVSFDGNAVYATDTVTVKLISAGTPKDRPPKDTINASLVLTPEEYAAIRDKSDWHQHAYPVELGEPAVVDGYLVWDDHRIPRTEEE